MELVHQPLRAFHDELQWVGVFSGLELGESTDVLPGIVGQTMDLIEWQGFPPLVSLHADDSMQKQCKTITSAVNLRLQKHNVIVAQNCRVGNQPLHKDKVISQY